MFSTVSSRVTLSGKVAFIVGVCLSTAVVSAQETRGSILGRVLDGSGAAVPNATVKATNVATNVSLAATSNAEGAYHILFLLPGNYSVEAAAPGFKMARREGIELRIHDRLQVDFNLEVGAVSERLEVTAEAP